MSIIGNIIPTYKRVRALQDYQTTATMPFQDNKKIGFTIYKDSVYDVVDKDGGYEINMGPYFIPNVPAEIFTESKNKNWISDILFLFFVAYCISVPFWLPEAIRKIKGISK